MDGPTPHEGPRHGEPSKRPGRPMAKLQPDVNRTVGARPPIPHGLDSTGLRVSSSRMVRLVAVALAVCVTGWIVPWTGSADIGPVSDHDSARAAGRAESEMSDSVRVAQAARRSAVAVSHNGTGFDAARRSREIPLDPDSWFKARAHRHNVSVSSLSMTARSTGFPAPSGRVIPLWEVELRSEGSSGLLEFQKFLADLSSATAWVHIPQLTVEHTTRGRISYRMIASLVGDWVSGGERQERQSAQTACSGGNDSRFRPGLSRGVESR